MTQYHARLDDEGRFNPFDHARKLGEFDLKSVSNRMRLRPLQDELFRQLMRQFEIGIWFWAKHGDDDHRRDAPGLEIVTFFPGEDDGPDHVSSADLFAILEKLFLYGDNEIGRPEEIAVLEKLKALCDRGIEERRQLIEQDKKDGAAS